MWLRQEQNVLLSFVNVCVCSVTQLCLTLGTARTITFQAPLSMGFSRQEYWNGLPFPPSRDFPHPGIEPTSPASQADSLPLSLLECPLLHFLPPKSIVLQTMKPTAAWSPLAAQPHLILQTLKTDPNTAPHSPLSHHFQTSVSDI